MDNKNFIDPRDCPTKNHAVKDIARRSFWACPDCSLKFIDSHWEYLADPKYNTAEHSVELTSEDI